MEFWYAILLSAVWCGRLFDGKSWGLVVMLGVVDVTKGWWSWNKFDSCFKCLRTGMLNGSNHKLTNRLIYSLRMLYATMLLCHGFMNKPNVL